MMEDNATSLLTGHIQIQNRKYLDNDRLEFSIPDAARLVRRVEDLPDVTGAAPRVETFALVSVGERSFGARIMGVDPVAEARVVRFQQHVVAGRSVVSGDEALLGETLARNLGAAVGEQIVVLGSAREGGVAALVLDVVGLFRTGQNELDRALIWAPLATVQNAFGLGGEAHTLALRIRDLGAVDAVTAQLTARLTAWAPAAVTLVARPWYQVLPDVRQAIAVDRVSAGFFYWIIMILVAFSVVNTFIMTVFERTREFGVLLAIGMRPASIMFMLQWEAFFVWVLGTGMGLGLALLLVFWLMQVGIYLGDDMAQLSRQMYMPTRLYPALAGRALASAPLVMLVGTQLAALVPSWRIRRLAPALALRSAA